MKTSRIIYSLLIIFNIALVTTSLQASELDIKFDKKIRKKFKNLLKEDLVFLKNFSFHNEASEETLKIFDFQKFDNESVVSWLNQRVNYIIDEKNYSKLKIETIDYFFPYENPNDLPEIDVDITDNESDKDNLTIMSNIGTAIYYSGKKSQRLLGIKIKEEKGWWNYIDVPVRSPRAGIIQIGEGLFNKKFVYSTQDPSSRGNKIVRLATLFHEARHSDGSGKDLGFLHVTCPKNHDYSGLKACDFNLNGPYTIGSRMLKEFINSCDNCAEDEKEILRLRALSSSNRVLKERQLVVSESEDDKINILKNLLFLKQRATQLKLQRMDEIKLTVSIRVLKRKIAELEADDKKIIKEKAEFIDPKPELNENHEE